MTLREFYTELNKTKGILDWTVRQPGQAIRGYSRGKEPKMFCPLTAVAYCSNQVYLDTVQGFAATAELEMSPDDSSAILLASDACPAYASVRVILEQILFGDSDA